MNHRSPKFRGRLAVFASAWLVAGLAQATEGDPLRVFLTETVTRDDNIYRRPAGYVFPNGYVLPIVADTITNTSVQVTLDKLLSRQHLQGSITQNYSRYQSTTSLNNDTTNYQAAWQGTFPSRLTADAALSRSQTLANYADLRSTTAKDLVTGDAAFLRLGYAFHPDWAVSVQATGNNYRNSATAAALNDLQTRGGEVSLQYSSPRGSRVSLLARTTNGHYTNPQLSGATLVNNDYRQKELQASAQWSPGAKSTLSLQVGQTRREQDDLAQRDFIGTTGSLSFNWELTAATSVNFLAGRNLTPDSTNITNYAVDRTYSIGAHWAPTAKVVATAGIDRLSREYSGDAAAAIANTAIQTYTTRGRSLGLQYAATNFIQLSLQFRHELRESNNPTYPYTSNVATLSGVLSF